MNRSGHRHTVQVLLTGDHPNAAQLHVDVVEGLHELLRLRQVAGRHERARHQIQLRLD